MKFDPDAMNYVFSTEQELTIEETAKLRSKLMENAFRPISGENSSPLKIIIAAVIFTIFLLAFIISAVTGHVLITIFIFGLMFTIGGLIILISKPKDFYSADHNYLKPKQNGLFVFLLGIVIMSAPLLINYSTKRELPLSKGNIFVIMFGCCFALAGGYFMLSEITGLFKSSRGYGEETEGECIGYVRSFHTSHETHHRTLVTSPVYEYYHDGQLLQAIGNEVYLGTAPIALGEHITLNIDPKDPYSIFELNENKKLAPSIIGICFPLLFVIVGIVLIWYGATHHIELSNQAVSDGKSIITDSYIQKKFGLGEGEWSIAEYTVTQITDNSDGSCTIELSNGSFRTDPEGDFRNSHSVGYKFYELTDSNGTPVASFSSDNWKYSGSKDCISYE